MKLIGYIKKSIQNLYFLLSQRTDDNGVTYLWKRHKSKSLIIVFSGIGHAPFNYVKTLKKIPCDQLFIKDSWAEGVSYYWMERLNNEPEESTQNIINHIITKGKYSTIYTIGSSKGGTAAIYYGLKNRVNVIIAGACQYHVGSYLAYHQYDKHPEQWYNMTGLVKPINDNIQALDNKLSAIIEESRDSNTKIHLLYSTEEHTYHEHIIPLIKKLDECNIKHVDYIEKFTNHSMIGVYFKKFLSDFFNKKQGLSQ